MKTTAFFKLTAAILVTTVISSGYVKAFDQMILNNRVERVFLPANLDDVKDTNRSSFGL
jgi:hypothetical protein